MECGRIRKKEGCGCGRTCTDALDGDCLWAVGGGRERLLGRVKGRVKESVDECGLSEAGFALEE